VLFIWIEIKETSFQNLKNALREPPVLELPDQSKEMILTTDASDIAISYNLSMMNDGQERIISYDGRRLRPAERNYTACEKECLGVILGVLYYREFLQPKPFLIRTENSALKFLNFVKHIQGRLGRWNMLLSGYNYRIEHIKGTKNVVADTLSRIELPVDSDRDNKDLDDKVANINTISDVTLNGDLQDRLDHVWAITLDKPTSDDKSDDDEVVETDAQTEDDLDNIMSPYNVQQLQNSCPDCRFFLDYFRNRVLQLDDTGARKIVYQSERYILQDGILCHLDLPRQRKKMLEN